MFLGPLPLIVIIYFIVGENDKDRRHSRHQAPKHGLKPRRAEESLSVSADVSEVSGCWWCARDIARDISDGVTQAGFSINRNQVKLGDPIKSIGLHTVAITLHPEVSVSIEINVARSTDEAKIQEKTGSIKTGDEAKNDSVEKLIEELDATEINIPSETEAEDQAARTLVGLATPSAENDPVIEPEPVDKTSE